MKAKEYVEKYGDAIIKETAETDYSETLKLFLQDLLDEAFALIKKRNAIRPSAIVSVFEEINNKYNSVASSLEKRAGEPILKRNGFKVICDKHYENNQFYENYIKVNWR